MSRTKNGRKKKNCNMKLAYIKKRYRSIIKLIKSSAFFRFISNPKVFAILVATIFFLANLVLVWFHEPWRDEANPWQIAKAINFENFYDVMRVEPHPMLWYLILAPFAKLGFPYFTTSIISLLIMTISVFLLVRFAPFSKSAKVAVVLSSAFLYFNSVISRNYCLVVLIVVILAINYKNRLAHPFRYLLLIALLLQTHFLASGLAGALFIVFSYDLWKHGRAKRSKLLPILFGYLLIAISLFSSMPMILGSLSSHDIINGSSSVSWNLSTLSADLNLATFGVAFPIFELTMSCLFLYLLFRRSYRVLLYLTASVGMILFSLVIVYSTGTFSGQKCSLIILSIVFCFFVSYFENTKINHDNFLLRHLELAKALVLLPITIVFLIPIILSIPHTICAAIFDLRDSYSYSKEVSGYISQNTPNNSIFLVADSTSAGLSITFVPLLKDGRQIYDVAVSDYIDFYQYDGYPEISLSEVSKVLEALPANRAVYFISTTNSCGQSSFTISEEWMRLKTFAAHPDSYESQLTIYKIRDAEPDVALYDINMSLVDSILSVESIPRFDITIADFDRSYGVWNDGLNLEISDSIIPENNSYGAMSGEIRTRGNTTYEAGVKYGPYQYKIKLDEAANLLGLGSHRKWVLLANFLDRSYLRQFYLSGVGKLIMGEQYFSPQMKYIELYINGDYQGLYLLAESIEEDENRLDIEKNAPSYQNEIPFLVQMENGRMPRTQGNWYDHDTFFMISDQATPCINYEWLNGATTTDTLISLEYPESRKDMTDGQYNYVVSAVSDLYSDAKNHVPYYDLGIDSNSFVNYFTFQDLMFNTGFGSSSVYFYKPLWGKITAGPLWDFDQLLMMDIGYGFTQPNTCDNNLYRYLLQYEEFRSAMQKKLLWIDEVLNPIISQQLDELQNNDLLRMAIEKNEAKYHTWGTYFPNLSVYQHPAIVTYTSWDDHIEHLRLSLFTGYSDASGQTISRAKWMVENFSQLD